MTGAPDYPGFNMSRINPDLRAIIALTAGRIHPGPHEPSRETVAAVLVRAAAVILYEEEGADVLRHLGDVIVTRLDYEDYGDLVEAGGGWDTISDCVHEVRCYLEGRLEDTPARRSDLEEHGTLRVVNGSVW